MVRNLLLVAIVGIAAIISSDSLSFAGMWQPYQFQPKNQEYEYKITNFEEGAEKVSTYVLKLEEKGEDQMEVSVKTTWLVGDNELDQQILGGWWAGGAFGLTMAFINPMYAAFFGGLDLHVGNKMSFFGAGVVEVTGTEKVAGRDGFVCQLLDQDGGTVQGRYVVDPTVPLPLKTELFDDAGNKQFQTELLRIDI